MGKEGYYDIPVGLGISTERFPNDLASRAASH